MLNLFRTPSGSPEKRRKDFEMNVLTNMLVSWKTTILGLAAVMGVLAKWATAGAVDFNDIPTIMAGLAGMAAKDSNVAGVK